MSFADDLAQEPWRHDFFAVLRRLERAHPERPRIGDSEARRDDYVLLGQDPFLEFPASTLSGAERDQGGRWHLLVRFLGLLGPQGALPLTTSEEAYGWLLARDDAYPRFLDILNHRFLQLFFRAWADSRPIAQHDRPDADRFMTYLGALMGIGSAPYRDADSVPDGAKLAYAGLVGAATKSASRLRGLIAGVLGTAVEIEEFVGSRLAFEPGDQSRLGRANATLGRDCLIGATVFSVEDKIRVRIVAKSLDEYRRFLPSGPLCEPLADLVFLYLGDQLEWDVELLLPAKAIEPTCLGRSGQLGWTSWMAAAGAGGEELRADSRFNPRQYLMERRGHMAAAPRAGE
ncbi:MAG TPA: type VI secretion system baseplate subunit TssG [Hyphomicrobiales bacterium]|nr:type VI secretion system baseplate subunit TssG [Hyphomicrobiales bacterium]